MGWVPCCIFFVAHHHTVVQMDPTDRTKPFIFPNKTMVDRVPTKSWTQLAAELLMAGPEQWQRLFSQMASVR